MCAAGWGEFDLIRWIRAETPRRPEILVNVGDDCAVLRFRGPVAVTTDFVVEGRHFDLETHSPEQVGRKALARSLSDIAAMGCRPVAAVAAVALPAGASEEFARRLYLGMRECADRYDTTIVGGDVSATSGPLVLCVTFLGDAGELKPVTRSGARVGDAIMVTGELGGSLLGHHLSFEPRVREGLWLNERVDLHAMIDLSDGLAADLGHILEESGVGGRIEEKHIPISSAARMMAEETGRSPLEHALHDGEDYELCFTLSPEDAERAMREWRFSARLTRIGWIEAEAGLRICTPNGGTRAVPLIGWEHRFP